ncbi:hypothetical protein RND71_043301 [Anisodus tanguticus]|uniref:Histidine decarboxylase n=1 Tax=Anisodus tanguticus TaxID=243964 RepID=A0AAE1QS98_9SOLA|nr:hypothetical protein RND71_043301 [Anisodus tanguticus]
MAAIMLLVMGLAGFLAWQVKLEDKNNQCTSTSNQQRNSSVNSNNVAASTQLSSNSTNNSQAQQQSLQQSPSTVLNNSASGHHYQQPSLSAHFHSGQQNISSQNQPITMAVKQNVNGYSSKVNSNLLIKANVHPQMPGVLVQYPAVPPRYTQNNAFGSATGTTGFGSINQQPQNSLFGNSTAGFGSTNTTNNLFGQQQTTTPSLFGNAVTTQPQSSVFGNSTANTEELRYEDYQAGRKGTAASPMFGSSNTQTGGLFTSNPSTSVVPFNSSNTSSSIFNSNKPAFGATTTTATTSIFNTTFNKSFGTTGNSFGTTQSQPIQPTQTSIFGTSNAAATTGFNQNNLFNISSQNNSTSTTVKPFFTATTAPTNSMFQSTSTTNNALSTAKPFFGTSTSTFGAPTSSSSFTFNPTTQAASTTTNSLFSANQGSSLFNMNPATNTQTKSMFNFPSQTTTLNSQSTLNTTNPTGSSLFNTSGLGTTTLGTTSNLFGTMNNNSNSLFGTSNNTTSALGMNQNTNQSGMLSLQQISSPTNQNNNNLLMNRLQSLPYGSSSLFQNKVGTPNSSLKFTTDPKILNQYKVSFTSSSNNQIQKTPTNTLKNTSLLFDGLDDENPDDKKTAFNIFVPRKNIKKLTIKPKDSSTLSTLTEDTINVQTKNSTQSDFTLKLPLNSKQICDSTVNADNTVLEYFRQPPKAYSSTPAANTSVSLPVQSPAQSVILDKSQANRNNQLILNSPETSVNVSLNDSQNYSILGHNSGDCASPVVNTTFSIPKCKVILNRTEYFTIPPLDQLEVDDNTCIVESFTVGRHGYGSIFWEGPLDIYGINLDECVHIRRKEVFVYPDDENKPEEGSGLNRPAQITLHKVWPIDKTTHEVIKDPQRLLRMNYSEKIENATIKFGGFFKEYRPDSGTWVFKVKHFSKYGLIDEDEEDEPMPMQITESSKKENEFEHRQNLNYYPYKEEFENMNSLSKHEIPPFNKNTEYNEFLNLGNSSKQFIEDNFDQQNISQKFYSNDRHFLNFEEDEENEEFENEGMDNLDYPEEIPQLLEWKTLQGDLFISKDLLKIYVLLSGETKYRLSNNFLIDVLDNLTWTQQLSLLLLYSVDNNLEDCINNMTCETNDVEYHLIANHNPLVAMSSAENDLEAWFLHQSLKSYGIIDSDTNSDVIHGLLSSQLMAKNIKWACYVACHITHDLLREYTLTELLFNYVGKLTTEDEDWLKINLRLHNKYIASIKAQFAKSNFDVVTHGEELLECEKWIEAHDVLVESIFPELVINEEYEKLKNLIDKLKPYKEIIPNWYTSGAHLFELARDLLHPDPKSERRKCKLKRLVPHPNSYFMDVKCPAKDVVDFIADYMQNIRDYRVFPAVQPGYMRQLLPDIAPESSESWDKIMIDIKNLVLPGITHWQSPYMHAYFPALNSPASLMGDMIADAFNCLGFTWASSPACTELEVIVMDWLAKAINLPACFMNKQSCGKGGGVIQTTSSEATFVALLCARTQAIRNVKQQQLQQFCAWEHRQQQLELSILKIQKKTQEKNTIQKPQSNNEIELDREMLELSLEELEQQLMQNSKNSPKLEEDSEINSKLVAYCSDQAHSSVEKASLIGLVKLRYVESDEKYSMDLENLEKLICQDKDQNKLIPFFICATLGTTGCCSFDKLRGICKIAKKYNCYVHVDAAYAGSAFICEEFVYLLDGIELVDSFAFNPSKWLNVHFDCTAMWLQNVSALHRTFNVNPLYLKHENTGFAIDYMHWQIPLSRRFRALKLWCVLRNYGINGLKNHIRNSIELSKYFEDLLKKDDRFEIAAPRILGLVVFRLRSGNELTECLLKKLNSDGQIHCVPASLRGRYVIRFTVTSGVTNKNDIERDWSIIQKTATKILLDEQQADTEITESLNKNLNDKKEIFKNSYISKTPKLKKLAAIFGTSLLLCNSPMTPKLVNGSYAAIIENQEIKNEFLRKFGSNSNWQHNFDLGNNSLKRRIKGLMFSDKQYSLDSRLDLVDSIMSSINMGEEKSFVSTGSFKDKKKDVEEADERPSGELGSEYKDISIIRRRRESKMSGARSLSRNWPGQLLSIR